MSDEWQEIGYTTPDGSDTMHRIYPVDIDDPLGTVNGWLADEHPDLVVAWIDPEDSTMGCWPADQLDAIPFDNGDQRWEVRPTGTIPSSVAAALAPGQTITLRDGEGRRLVLEVNYWTINVEHETREKDPSDPGFIPFLRQTTSTGRSTGTITFELRNR